MRLRVKLYTHRPLKFFSSPDLEILTDRVIFYFRDKTFIILYSELMHYEKYKKFIIMKIKKNNKNEPLSISICPRSSAELTQIFTQLDLFYKDLFSYVKNPLLCGENK